MDYRRFNLLSLRIVIEEKSFSLSLPGAPSLSFSIWPMVLDNDRRVTSSSFVLTRITFLHRIWGGKGEDRRDDDFSTEFSSRIDGKNPMRYIKEIRADEKMCIDQRILVVSCIYIYNSVIWVERGWPSSLLNQRSFCVRFIDPQKTRQIFTLIRWKWMGDVLLGNLTNDSNEFINQWSGSEKQQTSLTQKSKVNEWVCPGETRSNFGSKL